MRRAEIERAKANLALIESQLADTIAISPVDGVVLVKAADVGEVLEATRRGAAEGFGARCEVGEGHRS